MNEFSATEAGQSSGAAREFSRHMGVSDTKEFLAAIGGRATRWPLLIAVSLLAVGIIGYSASRIMFAKALTAPMAVEQGDDIDMQSTNHSDSRKPRKAFAFSFQSEAEAAVEHDYSSEAPPQNRGEKSEPGKNSKNTELYSQVHALLKSASEAVKGENLESFLALMDENEKSFVRTQKIKAKIAFKQFDEIDGTYTDIKIKALNANELAVNLHCKVDATYSRSGRRIALFDGDQHITLRRATGADWKICSIE